MTAANHGDPNHDNREVTDGGSWTTEPLEQGMETRYAGWDQIGRQHYCGLRLC
jgi:hypothetical protein